MKDRNGIEVRVGDRVLVLRAVDSSSEINKFGAVRRVDSACPCSTCAGRLTAEVHVGSYALRSCSCDMELPVTTAIARLREAETKACSEMRI